MIEIKGHVFENGVPRSVCSRCNRAVQYNYRTTVGYGLIFRKSVTLTVMISEKKLTDCNDLLFEQLLK